MSQRTGDIEIALRLVSPVGLEPTTDRLKAHRDLRSDQPDPISAGLPYSTAALRSGALEETVRKDSHNGDGVGGQ